MGIRITTDNCCDLSPELLDRYQIAVGHLRVRFGEKEYEPGELTNAEFYHMMSTANELPTTSQPSVEDLVENYTNLLANGDEVIAIHLSSGISGTVQGANLAANLINNPRLHVVDSLKASVGEGLLVLEAARMASEGRSVTEVLQRLQEMQRNLQCIFFVGNLDALIKGGRISKARALIAGALDIKPLLYFNDQGQIMPLEKVRGYRKGLRRLVDIMGEMSTSLSEQVVGICHGADPETAEFLKQEINQHYHPREVVIGEIGPVIGAHVGPGTFSVFFNKDA
ncbi:MAG: DegV family protein [Methylocystaceae bacterium]